MLLTFVISMAMASHHALAQEVTITLNPGFTWFSYLGTEPQNFATVLGSFTPAVGDIILSQWGSATYMANGQWRGSISQFYPGYGYMYKSNRSIPVTLTMGEPLPQLSVTTAEPTDITTTGAVVGGIVTIEEGNHVFARGVCWGTEPNPDIDGSHTTDATIAGSLSDTLTELSPGTTYYVRAYMVTDYGLSYGEELNFTTEIGSSGDHAYVDLGLPSGLLWATCNVGADTPEDYGDYFAWGETQPKDYYDWSTYQHCNGSNNTFTKYCTNSSYGYNGFTDDLTTLEPSDDAATANWGDGWRMPTQAEFQELLDNTTVTWTTQNGVNGRLFTAANGNSLFLPATGFRSIGELNYVGNLGCYWSSSLFTSNPGDARFLYFGWGYCYMGTSNRPLGFTVRPVREN